MVNSKHLSAGCAALAVVGMLLSAPAFAANAGGGDTARDIPGGEAGVPPAVQDQRADNPIVSRGREATPQTAPQNPAASQQVPQTTTNTEKTPQ
jgi:hypothetical protein